MLTCHCTVEGRIFCTYIVNDETIETRHTIPLQPVQILTDGVQSVTGQNGILGILDFVLSRDVVLLFQIDTQIGIVSVAPQLRFLIPRQTFLDEVKTRKLIVPQMPCQLRVSLQYTNDVLCR